jgi:hypothetical protein
MHNSEFRIKNHQLIRFLGCTFPNKLVITLFFKVLYEFFKWVENHSQTPSTARCCWLLFRYAHSYPQAAALMINPGRFFEGGCGLLYFSCLPQRFTIASSGPVPAKNQRDLHCERTYRRIAGPIATPFAT